MRRGTWFNTFAAEGGTLDLQAETREELARLTLDFVANTATTLDQLNGLDISGGRIENIRCYLTGRNQGGGRYLINRFHLSDKHWRNAHGHL